MDSDNTTYTPPQPSSDIRKSLEIIEIHNTRTLSSETGTDTEKGPPTALEASHSPAHPIISFWRRTQETARYNEIATQPSVFDDPVTAAYFAPPVTYENAHRFDPGFRWTWGEELAAVNKLDWRVTLWSLILFIAYDMNRSNLIQANTDNFLPDLHLNTDDYNMGNTVLRVTGLCAEIPGQLIARKVGM